MSTRLSYWERWSRKDAASSHARIAWKSIHTLDTIFLRLPCLWR